MKKILFFLFFSISLVTLGQELDISLINKQAIKAYNDKNYEEAGKKYLELSNYFLQSDIYFSNFFKYYSAISYQNAGLKEEALKLFSELVDQNYTGVNLEYIATNKNNGEIEKFDKKTWEEHKINSKNIYRDFKITKTESIEEDLYNTYISLLLMTDEDFLTLNLIESCLKKYPNNNTLIDTHIKVYEKLGIEDKLVSIAKNNLTKRTNDFKSLYVLGILTGKNPQKKEEAIQYFQKIIAINPNFSPAYQKICDIIISDDSFLTESYIKFRNSNSNLANRFVQERISRRSKALTYAENRLRIDPLNSDAISYIKNLNFGQNQQKEINLTIKEKEDLEKEFQTLISSNLQEQITKYNNEKKNLSAIIDIKKQIQEKKYNGNSTFIFRKYKYSGNFNNGLPNGIGKWEKSDGSWYEGQFKNGVENGMGTLRQTNGLRYTGNFTNGVPNGIFKIEKWTLMGLAKDAWTAEYNNGKLINSSQTETGLTDFVSGRNYSSETNNAITSNNQENGNTTKIPKIKKFENMGEASINLTKVQKYWVEFQDGVSGYLYKYYEKEGGKWAIYDGLAKTWEYETKEEAIKELYNYKN